MTIESFKHRGLVEFFINGRTARIGHRNHQKLIELLDILDAATDTRDLAGVSDFHPLRGIRRRDDEAQQATHGTGESSLPG